jgi:MFS family permease
VKYRDVLANRDYRLVWLGRITSQLGDACYEVAIVWLVLQLTDQDYFSVGVVVFARLAPYVLIGPVAGVFVDRWDRRRLMVACDLGRAGVVFAVPLLHLAGALEVWHVALVAFVLTTLRSFFNPALQASLPALVAPGQLVPANALIQASVQTVGVVGPALAGLALVRFGTDALFVANGVTFLVSALCVAFLRLAHDRTGTDGHQPMLAEITGAIRLVHGIRPVFWSVVLYAVGLLTIAGSYRVGLAALAEETIGGGASTYGLLLSALGLGTVAGALVVGKIRTARPTRIIFAGWALWGVAFAVLGFTGSPLVAALLAIVAGVAESAATVFTTALVQAAIPVDQLGKVFSLWSLLCSIGESLSGLVVGLGLGRVQPAIVFLASGAATVLVGVAGLALTATDARAGASDSEADNASVEKNVSATRTGE